MSDIELKKIADNSDMIVNGYSFTKKNESGSAKFFVNSTV